jgi:glycolate oxidase
VGVDLLSELRRVLGDGAVDVGDAIHPDDLHDESLHAHPVTPLAVVHPHSRDDVVAIVEFARRHRIPLTARGSGTGLSGGAIPVTGGLLVSFREMNAIRRIDLTDHVAVVEPGVTLAEIGEALAGTGLCYPVYPGELSGSLGGNVNTNAGGMRAVRHGVTRQHVLALEAVLVDGTVVRTGGPIVKSSSGYDLTQLLVGSEGTLALVTEVTIRLTPALAHATTVLVPYGSLEEVTAVVPQVIAAGVAPSILEYVDTLAMRGITRAADLELGISEPIANKTAAYLIIVLETRTASQLESDLESLGSLLGASGALEIYVLAAPVAVRLIEARERAFWSAKAAGAHDIVDVVVPRSQVTSFLATAGELATRHGTLITGCGHVGDGNVHLSVFQPDDAVRAVFLRELFTAGVELGGAVSGEHGIGRDKQADYLALADPTLVRLQRAIKDVFDPDHLLNPYRHLDDRVAP